MAFTVNQVFGVVNEVAQQVFGESAIEVIDLQGLISLGDKVLNSEDDRELFINALVNRIGSTVVTNRPYSGAVKNIMRNVMEYGSVLQKLYVAPFEAEANSSHGLVQGQVFDLGSFNPPTAEQYMFECRDVYQFTVTLPDHQINTAFTSAESLSAFISAIYVSMETSVEIAIENMTNLCIANYIGEKLAYEALPTKTGVHAINLLAEYNQFTGLTLTPEEAITSTEFLKFSGRVIRLHMKKMAKLNTIYNTKQFKRHTPEANLNLFILTEYASANTTYLQSNTYHNELVALPNYSEVPYWQGMGLTGSLEEVSTVEIITTSGTTINQPYVVALLCDEETIGVMYNRRASKAFYVPQHEVTQKYEKVELGYYNDMSENGLVFYLA